MHNFVIKRIYEELSSIVGEKSIYTSNLDKDVYSVDVWSVSRNWADNRMLKELPDFIVLPENAEQISKILKVANQFKIPVLPRGGGAGALGGGIPFFGGIIIDTKKLDKVLEFNESSMFIKAQTGMLQIDLEKYLNHRGYTLNHLPASIYCSTLGGFLSTRGSGVLSSKYGKIEDMVMSLEVVLPTGEVINTLPVPKHSVGPSIEKFFIGAEGTFGVITNATLQVFHLPEARLFRGFLFNEFHSAMQASREVMTEGLKPSVLRLYDEGDTKDVVKKELGIDIKSGSYMVIGFDGFKEIAEIQEKKAMDIFMKYNARDLGREFGEKWWNNRYDPYYPPHSLESKLVLFGVIDTVTTHDKIEKLYFETKNTVEREFKEWGITYTAHFSHWYEWGASVYPRFIIKNYPKDPKLFLELNNKVWKTAIKVILENGGVLSEHHGIGFQISPFMRDQYKDGFKVLEVFKKGIDPNNIMNPTLLGFNI